jgi:hypothetical protein
MTSARWEASRLIRAKSRSRPSQVAVWAALTIVVPSRRDAVQMLGTYATASDEESSVGASRFMAARSFGRI